MGSDRGADHRECVRDRLGMNPVLVAGKDVTFTQARIPD
jgi:hypothetical protein